MVGRKLDIRNEGGLKLTADQEFEKELHRKLIEEKLEGWHGLKKSSIDHFAKYGKVSGTFYLALIDYAEAYHNAKIEKIEKYGHQ